MPAGEVSPEEAANGAEGLVERRWLLHHGLYVVYVLDVGMGLFMKSAVLEGGVLIGMASKQVLGEKHLMFDQSLLGGVGGTGRTRRMLEPCQCLRACRRGMYIVVQKGVLQDA